MGATAVIKKDIKTYFYSPVAYVLIGVFLFVMGFLFAAFVTIYFKVAAQQRMGGGQGITLNRMAEQMFMNMAFMLSLFTPLLTMKLFAEERNQNTLELLLTAPIKTGSLVWGKFVAAYILMGVMLVLSMVYPAFMVLWGNPQVAVLAGTYLGLFLMLACYISLGGLISALTNTQAIAAVFTLITLLLLWLLQALGQNTSATIGSVQLGPLLVYLSPTGHFNSFNQGLIQLKDVVYFLSFTGLMLFLTHRAVESNRWR